MNVDEKLSFEINKIEFVINMWRMRIAEGLYEMESKCFDNIARFAEKCQKSGALSKSFIINRPGELSRLLNCLRSWREKAQNDREREQIIDFIGCIRDVF